MSMNRNPGIKLSFVSQEMPTMFWAKLLHTLRRNLAHSFERTFFPFSSYETLQGSSGGTGQARS
jgi:hypothetical protein